MCSFKKGDKVVCLDNFGPYVKDQVYTILDVWIEGFFSECDLQCGSIFACSVMEIPRSTEYEVCVCSFRPVSERKIDIVEWLNLGVPSKYDERDHVRERV